jgi:hypothetical protein
MILGIRLTQGFTLGCISRTLSECNLIHMMSTRDSTLMMEE